MKNQSGEIPPHLHSTWSIIAEELRLASEELHEARARHHSAVMARIAFRETTDEHQEAPEWKLLTKEFEEAHDELHTAHVRYNHAVNARTELSHALNAS